jgi:hypothetical protein
MKFYMRGAINNCNWKKYLFASEEYRLCFITQRKFCTYLSMLRKNVLHPSSRKKNTAVWKIRYGYIWSRITGYGP